jgi:hypothetical protein
MAGGGCAIVASAAGLHAARRRGHRRPTRLEVRALPDLEPAELDLHQDSDEANPLRFHLETDELSDYVVLDETKEQNRD